MIRENVSDHLDYLFDRLASFSTVHARMPEITEATRFAIAAARDDRPNVYDMFKIASRGRRRSVDPVTHGAWILSHVVGSRVHCVRYPIVKVVSTRRVVLPNGKAKKAREYQSPILEQCRRLGLAPKSIPLEFFYRELTQTDCVKNVASVYADERRRQLSVVGIVTTSAACRFGALSSGLELPRGETLPLFAPTKRPWRNVKIQSRVCRAVCCARDLLAEAIPGWEVRAQILVVTDPGINWGYQLHDVTGLDRDQIKSATVSLDEFDVVRSILDHKQDGRIDVDFSGIPDSLIYSDVLAVLPVTRACRSFMALKLLWDRQQRHPQRLEMATPAELASAIEERYRIHYPDDVSRHDFEDCLEQGSYIDRPSYERDAYAITPRGVGRLMLMQVTGETGNDDSTDDDYIGYVTDAVTEQGRRWDDYCFGSPSF